MPERRRRPARMEDYMFKSIALMGAAVGLVVSVASAQAALNQNGLTLNDVTLNGLSSNGLSSNGINTNGINTNGIDPNGTSLSALTGFAVEWVELPDGTVATY
jgi:hypothetical protein